MIDYLRTTRRHLHQHPELSMQEYKTTSFIKHELDTMGVSYDTPLKTGVVAYIRGTSENAIAFRADIDALPIHEQNNIAFQSIVPGVMHACGHDGHTSILLGFVKVVKELQRLNQLKHTVYFIFQPSEETQAGANQLLNAYTFEIQPDFIFGLHMMPDNDEGLVLSKPGPITASATEYRFFIDGKSAHVANKQLGHSAGEALTLLLSQLGQLQHYHLSGLKSNIIHIGKFTAGEAINTVPMQGYLEGTIRTFDTDDLNIIKEKMTDIKQAIEVITKTSVRLVFSEGYPPTINDEQAYQLIKNAAENTGLTFIENTEPYLFGEDFSFYANIAPTAFAFLGCRNENKHYMTGLHTDTFNFDETVLVNGVKLFEAILKQYEAIL